MKKYTVTWTETYNCKKTVEADSAEEAMAKCYDTDTPDKKEFEGYADWSARLEGDN